MRVGAMPMTYVFTRGAMGEAASVTRVVAGTARQWVEKLRGGQGGVRGWGEGGGGLQGGVRRTRCGAGGRGGWRATRAGAKLQRESTRRVRDDRVRLQRRPLGRS